MLRVEIDGSGCVDVYFYNFQFPIYVCVCQLMLCFVARLGVIAFFNVHMFSEFIVGVVIV